MQSSGRRLRPGFTAATRLGWIVRVAFVLWAMDKLTSEQFFSKFAQYGYDGWAVLEWESVF